VVGVPKTNPVTPEVGELGVVTAPGPETMDHKPVPIEGVFPAKDEVDTLHKPWFSPASAIVGLSSTVIVTELEDDGQNPLEIVHSKVAEPPMDKPVTSDVGSDASVIVALPEVTDHIPVPTVGVFPVKVVVVTLHKFWFPPLLDTVGGSELKTVISSNESGQVPLAIVQRRVTSVPGVRPVIGVFSSFISVIVAVPLSTVHVPVPTIAVFPARLVEVTLQRVWSTPASAVVGDWSTVIVTSENDGAHTPFEMVHLITTEVPGVRAVMVVDGFVSSVIVAEPLCTVHNPVPSVGVFPANVAVVVQTLWSEPALDAVGVL
jgi:hypothetical protein